MSEKVAEIQPGPVEVQGPNPVLGQGVTGEPGLITGRPVAQRVRNRPHQRPAFSANEPVLVLLEVGRVVEHMADQVCGAALGGDLRNFGNENRSAGEQFPELLDEHTAYSVSRQTIPANDLGADFRVLPSEHGVLFLRSGGVRLGHELRPFESGAFREPRALILPIWSEERRGLGKGLAV